MTNIKILPAGDSAVCAEFGREISPEINRKVTALKKALEKKNLPGISEMIPSFRSLLILYHPLILPYDELEKAIRESAEENIGATEGKKRIFHIPVCYSGREYAPDMPSVCDYTSLSEKEVIGIHTGTDYRVYMLGFLPGFAYLGGMSEKIAVPRLETPRKKIFAGAVGIGGSQTGVYPLESPGGWRLIGKTPVRLYAKEKKEPVLLRAGDYVRFFAISEAELQVIARQEENGTYTPEITEEAPAK